MFDEQASNTMTKGNLDLLCDVETFLGLNYIIPLFKCMQSLSRFAQAQDVFIFILLMQLKLVKESCTNDMLIQLQAMGMLMGFSKYSLQLRIIHTIPYIWLGFFNLILVWII
jgi:hypothetical protein